MDEMHTALQLTLEQEFQLRRYTEEAQKLTPTQSRDYLLNLMRQVMIKDNVIRHLMKQAL